MCASLYPHRTFECPWQYVPDTVLNLKPGRTPLSSTLAANVTLTLTDELGCWRPSTGIR